MRRAIGLTSLDTSINTSKINNGSVIIVPPIHTNEKRKKKVITIFFDRINLRNSNLPTDIYMIIAFLITSIDDKLIFAPYPYYVIIIETGQTLFYDLFKHFKLNFI